MVFKSLFLLLSKYQIYQFQHSFVIGGDSNRSITNMVVSAMGVWLSLQNSAVLRLVHSLTREILAEVNTAPAVTKMLSSKFMSLYPCTLDIIWSKIKSQKYWQWFFFLNRFFPLFISYNIHYYCVSNIFK